MQVGIPSIPDKDTFHVAFERLYLAGRVQVAMLVLTLAIALPGGLVVWLLWNWLVPDIFGIQALSYWQGWGLFALAGVLFKGPWFPATWLPSKSK